jgi:hypothetical protein
MTTGELIARLTALDPSGTASVRIHSPSRCDMKIFEVYADDPTRGTGTAARYPAFVEVDVGGRFKKFNQAS